MTGLRGHTEHKQLSEGVKLLGVGHDIIEKNEDMVVEAGTSAIHKLGLDLE
jgi:hypothetical protein